jgi:transcriptional regulator with XRE-family HTH domain
MADWEDAPKKSSGGWEDAPSTPRTREATTLEKAGAAARGVATGALGGPGDIEYFATTTVPQIFGGTGETGTVMGRKTLFPTSEELEKGIQSAEKFVGAKPGVRPELESWRGGGEFVGGIFTPGQIARNVLEKPIKAGAELIGRARGKPLTEATGKLEQQLGTTAERTGKEIEAKTKADVERLAAEQARRGVAQRALAGQMDEAAKVAKEESVTALNKIAKPTNDYDIGVRLREKVVGREAELSKAAAKEAERLKGIYFGEGAAKEQKGQFWSQSQTGQEFLKYLKSVTNPANSGAYTRSEIAAANDLIESLSGVKVGGKVVRSEIGKIEKIIREVKELPSRATMTGADALKQQYMGKLAQKLEDSVYGYVDEAGDVVKGFAPTGRVFREVYRDMMKPLNAYESPVGKVLTQQLEGLKGLFTADATAIPATVFKSPQQIQILERMGVSKSSLEPFAAQYTSNQLSKLNKAEDVAKWLGSTEASYLKEFPELAKKAEQYASTFAKNEATVAKTTQSAADVRKAAEKVARDVPADIKSLREMSVADRKEVTDGLYKVVNAKNVPSQARTYVLGLKEKGLIQEAESNVLLEQIRQVEAAAADKQSAVNALKGVLPWAGAVIGGGAVTGYSLNKLLGGL